MDKGLHKFFFKIYKPVFKASKIGLIWEKDEDLGLIVGINLKTIDFKDQRILETYIKSIQSLYHDKFQSLYIEGIESIPLEAIRRIELETGLTIPKGINIKISSILPILEKIYEIKNEDLEDKEVLIISNDKDLSFQVIKSIWDRFNFISLVNLDQKMEDLHIEVFEEKGISLHEAKMENLNLKSYHIIINLYDDFMVKSRDIRGNTIVFDFTFKKPFTKLNKNFVMEDVNFKINNKEVGINDLINDKIPSALYEKLIDEKKREFCQVSINNKYYYLKDYLSNSSFGIKGCF